MLTDIWAHRYKADPKLLEEIEDEDFDPNNVAAAIGHGGQPPGDDDWENLS